MCAIEELLRNEYHAVMREIDRAKTAPLAPYGAEELCRRCVETMRRLRHFLAEGTVPADIAERIEAQLNQPPAS